MDDITLQGLKAAWNTSPDNPALLTLLMRAHLERNECEEGARLIAGKTPAEIPSEEARCVAAKLLLGADDPQRALDFATGDLPETKLLRARVLHALGRSAEGAPLYRAAVDANPTLEDMDLRAIFTATVRSIEPASVHGPRLRVIANDDTDETEISRLLAPPEKTITFQDVGGLEGIKEQIRKKIILPFQKPSLFERFRKRVGGGILLYGPPGCGKTLLARATAGECNASFFNVAISDILDMYIGESERKLHAIFEQARQKVPAVLFFDELEALAGKRQYSREGTSSKLVSQFLSEMDGFAQANRGVLVLGATNVPWAIDSAFLRPGRFDRVLFVPPPDAPARESILQLLLNGRPCAERIDMREIARRTSGFSGADLNDLVESAADNAIERSLASGDESPIEQSDLERACKEAKPTALEWLTTARNYARYANESGQYDEVLSFLKQHGRD
ncbi:MAG: AAA family ATPase [Myxococcaceae bacterium]